MLNIQWLQKENGVPLKHLLLSISLKFVRQRLQKVYGVAFIKINTCRDLRTHVEIEIEDIEELMSELKEQKKKKKA